MLHLILMAYGIKYSDKYSQTDRKTIHLELRRRERGRGREREREREIER